MTEEIWTPLKLINWTKHHFAKKGIEQARFEAELLLAKALGWERIDLYSRFNDPIDPDKLAAFREMVRRRAGREPAQYIMGRTEFHGLMFRTDHRALIPRPETEIIVDVVLELAKNAEQPFLVDVGTGSGVLAVCAAVTLPNAKVTACDISHDALELARENAHTHEVDQFIDFRHGDFVEVLAGLAGKVDIVMANPPYVKEGDFEGLAPELREHEPKVALVAGPDGMEMHRRLVEFAPSLLKPGGHLVLEIGIGQSVGIRHLVEESDQLELDRFEKDLASIERVAVIRRK